MACGIPPTCQEGILTEEKVRRIALPEDGSVKSIADSSTCCEPIIRVWVHSHTVEQKCDDAFQRLTREEPKVEPPEDREPRHELLTIAEACTALRISRSKLFEVKRSGDLAVIKIGHRTFIRREELDRFISAAQVQPSGRKRS
jgi:excisionase family DNA binding protein